MPALRFKRGADGKPQIDLDAGGPKDGMVNLGRDIDWTQDVFNRDPLLNAEKFFIFYGMWKGPFDSARDAKEAYQEWVWEAKHS